MPVTLEDIFEDLEQDYSVTGHAFILKMIQQYLQDCTKEEKQNLKKIIEAGDGEQLLAVLFAKNKIEASR